MFLSLHFSLSISITLPCVQLEFYHRQNGRNTCTPRDTVTCNGALCSSTGNTTLGSSPTDQDGTGQGRWCQSEVHTKTTIKANRTLALR